MDTTKLRELINSGNPGCDWVEMRDYLRGLLNRLDDARDDAGFKFGASAILNAKVDTLGNEVRELAKALGVEI